MVQHLGRMCRGVVSIGLLATAAGAACGQVAFEEIPSILPGDASWAYAVSSDGTWVVGRSGTNYYYGSSGHGYRWSHNSGTEDLDPLVGESTAYGVSSDGQTIVGYENQGSRGWRAFIWDPVNGMDHVYRDGMLLGVAGDASHCVGYEVLSNSPQKAVRWVMGARNPDFLDTANLTSSSQATATSTDGSVVVGSASFTAIGQRAFRWTEASGFVNIGAAAGGPSSQASGISGSGEVVVGTLTDTSTPFRTHAFRWSSGAGMQTLASSSPAFAYSVASGISTDGTTIVGKSHSDGAFTTSGFMWRADIGVQQLQTVLAAVLPAGWHVTEANATSADGRVIVGTATNAFGLPKSFKATVGTCLAPTVAHQPEPTQVHRLHQTITLSSPVGGFAPFTYQWQAADATEASGWRSLSDMQGHVAGSLSDTLTLTDVTNLDSGSYRCLITNACGSTVSSAADVLVCLADYNADSSVDFFDYLDFVDAFAAGATGADFNADGSIDFFDYLDLVDAYSVGC